jgi:HlyD family secretion protein
MGRVYVVRNGVATPVRVHVGLTDGAFIEVSGNGLSPGTAVIVEQTDDGANHAPGGTTTRSPLGGSPAGASGSRRPF